jgi:probable phosphoglycerate mutase
MTQQSLFGAAGSGSAIANIDGGSRGNPGPAGYGVRIERDGEIVEITESCGIATNNVAEYNGLLAALRWAVAQGVASLHVRSDSLLLVQQMKGVYRVKHPGLLPLFEAARVLSRQVGKVTFEHVRRELNKDADRLANDAMDAAARVAP